ncbi:MAG TPA: phage tail protein [Flavisolibacter sp.]
MGNYPLSKYHFRVDWGGQQVSFSEVSGLSMEVEVVEYREGSSPSQQAVKIPGLKRFSNLVLKRAVQKNDNEFFNWIKTVGVGAVDRRDIVISLLNEAHEPVVGWKVRNAWPCKYEVAGLDATANEVLIETLELAHEGFEIM